jgi:hypothetical protein
MHALDAELKKSVECATRLRIAYIDSLESSNFTLTDPENSSTKAEQFVKRAQVYLKLEKYQHCLNNIRLAIDHGQSAEDVLKLKGYEKTCRKALKAQKPEDDPWNFFKLTYAPHSKIPFIADCLEIKRTSQIGRGIYTNRDLQPGDVISIEETFLPYHTSSSSSYTRCHNCMSSNMLDLLPCSEYCYDGESFVIELSSNLRF